MTTNELPISAESVVRPPRLCPHGRKLGTIGGCPDCRGELREGDGSPHADEEPGAEVAMVNSVRIGGQRPYCTGCGGPLD